MDKQIDIVSEYLSVLTMEYKSMSFFKLEFYVQMGNNFVKLFMYISLLKRSNPLCIRWNVR
jgi:hypothetical protein